MVFKLTPNFTNTDPGSVFPANASPRNAECYTGLRLMPRKKQIHDDTFLLQGPTRKDPGMTPPALGCTARLWHHRRSARNDPEVPSSVK